MAKHWKTLLNGIIKENPVLVLALGTCPTLAVTTMAFNGLGMGLAATLVLIGTNTMISLLKNVIPSKVRIPAYITIIAGMVTIVMLLVQGFLPDLNKQLGIFLPLIVVNCIILARAEMFASKNTVLASAFDGLGMGLGFTLALVLMGSIRELIGSGTIFGLTVTKDVIDPMIIFILAPGGFFVFGILIAITNKVLAKRGKTRPETGCAMCPSREFCKNAGQGDCSEANFQ
ncbi:MAG: electron transport complex subunit E [Oscillospiraceae bacterium]|jgi:electron transport complex protein RnfE|nr:electron transport complex subunit E [Oscillospiraceae bacterium]